MELPRRWIWEAVAFAAGFPALIAQVVWSRQVALAAGSESEALGLVLALFFAGLAAGALLLGPWAESPRRSGAGAYAWLEGGVAVLLLGIGLLDATFGAAQLTESLGLGRRLGAAGVIAPATLLMGGTLPALLRAARGGRPAAQQAGRLVAWNTSGSVLGTILAVYAIPEIGLRACLVAAGGLSATVATIALLQAGREAAGATAADTQAIAPTPTDTAPTGAGAESALWRPGLAGLLTFGTGFTTLAFEVAITRLATLGLGSSLWAWGAVLATTLAGLALGNAAGVALLDRTRRPSAAHRVAPLLVTTAVALALAAFVLGHHPAMPARGLDLLPLVRTVFAVLGVMVGLGASFPVIAQLAIRSDRRATDFGRFQAANTLGGVAGSLLCAFAFLPAFGPLLTLRGLACSLLVLAAAAGLATSEGRPSMTPSRGVALSLLVALLLLVPTPPIDPTTRASVLSLEHGRRATTVVLGTPRSRELRVEGDPEASTFGRARRTEMLLAALPFAYHPAPERFLELGLGAGITLATAARFGPSTLECVEIAPSVLRAQVYFQPDNAIAPGRYGDGAQVRIGDARTYLQERVANPDADGFDIIAANTAQPWSVHASSLYAREHYERIRASLAQGGIAAQWLPYERVPAESLGEILATFFSVFEHGGLWWGEGSLFLLGSPRALPPFDAARAQARFESADLGPDALGLARIESLPLRRFATADQARPVLDRFSVLLENRPSLEARPPAPDSLGALGLLAAIAEAGRRDAPRSAAIAAFIDALHARARGDSARADSIDASLMGTGIALGEATILERRLGDFDRALRQEASGDAEAIQKELARRFPGDPRVHVAAAVLAERRQDPLAAIAALQTAAAHSRSDPSSALRLGQLLERTRAEEAEQAYGAALAIDPNLVPAIAGRGRLAIRRGDIQAVRSALDRLRSLSPLGPRDETRALERALLRESP